jgi:LPXTG-motif cell wall-anchored protein
MHTWVRRALCALGLTGGALLLGFLMAESASAAGNHTNGQDGIGSGNQTGIGVQAPVNATGNQVTVIGHDNHATNSGDAASAGGTTPSGNTSGGDNTTTGQDGIGSGNQTGIGVQAPVNVTGNQITVIGHDNTATASGNDARTGAAGGDNTTTGQDGIGSGNQTGIGVQAPVNATGNQITVIGHDNHATSSGDAASAGGTTPSGGTSGGVNTTSGQDGIGSGNQTAAPVEAPINTTGNQVTVVGDGNTANSSGGTSVVSPPTTGSPGSAGSTRTPGSTGSTGQTSPPRSISSAGAQGGPVASARAVAPVAGVLPNTGAPGGVAGLAALALALLAGGGLLLRRRAVGC